MIVILLASLGGLVLAFALVFAVGHLWSVLREWVDDYLVARAVAKVAKVFEGHDISETYLDVAVEEWLSTRPLASESVAKGGDVDAVVSRLLFEFAQAVRAGNL